MVLFRLQVQLLVDKLSRDVIRWFPRIFIPFLLIGKASYSKSMAYKGDAYIFSKTFFQTYGTFLCSFFRSTRCCCRAKVNLYLFRQIVSCLERNLHVNGTLFRVNFSIVVITWLSRPMAINGLVFTNSSMLHRVNVILSSATKVSGGLSIEICFCTIIFISVRKRSRAILPFFLFLSFLKYWWLLLYCCNLVQDLLTRSICVHCNIRTIWEGWWDEDCYRSMVGGGVSAKRDAAHFLLVERWA